MTKFTDGPAEGVSLMLRRAPLFLRVTVGDGMGGQWDALDQLNDAPETGEAVYAYRRVSKDGAAFVDWTDKKGRRQGGCFQMATYAVVAEQPDDATLRDTEKWRAWCLAQVAPKPEGQQP